MKKCESCNKNLQGNQRKYCSGACKQKAHWYKVKEQRNTYHAQTIRALTRKIEFINKLGGCCTVCGYNKNISALDFHHINSEQKSFPLDAKRLSNTNKNKLLEELDKCVLICSNCHREHHNPEMELSNVLNILRTHISSDS